MVHKKNTIKFKPFVEIERGFNFGFYFFIFSFISVFLNSIIILGVYPELEYKFIPTGLMFSTFIVSFLVSYLSDMKIKIYWEQIKCKRN